MSTQTKKSPAASSASASKASASASTSNQNNKASFKAAENVVKISGNAVKDLISSGSDEMQRAHQKMFELSRESAESVAKSADIVSKVMYEMVTMYRDNVDACLECSGTITGLAKSLSQEATDYIGKSFSDNVEISKEAIGCRTLNDVMDLQSKVMKRTVDNYFTECMRIYNLMFECASEAIEPINQRVSDATEQVSRLMAA